MALAGGGAAWTVHLCASYFLVALGCPRSWPVGAMLAAVTVVTVTASAAVGVAGARGWRAAPVVAHEDREASRLIFAAAALLGGLFTLAILLGSVAAVILSPCRAVSIGG